MSQLGVLPRPEEECDAIEAQPGRLTRRHLFASLIGMSTAMFFAAIGTQVLRFILYPLRASAKSGQWCEVGDTAEFDGVSSPVIRSIALKRIDGWREVISEQTVIVNRTAAGELVVLSTICPHLGCTVAWHDDKERFICPCHGGQFDNCGQRVSGPPPRGLDRLEAQIHDGRLQVRFD